MKSPGSSAKTDLINGFFLKFIFLFTGLYRRMGASIPQLEAILKYKLMMDDRRPASFSQLKRKPAGKGEPLSGQSFTALYFAGLLGLLYLTAFNFSNDISTNTFVYFSLFMLMLASTLVSDFTSVLIDIRDNFIILPKPVNDRTVVLARILHILIHVSRLVLPMAVPGFIYMIVRAGPLAGGVFLVMILEATLFAVFAVNALYIFILRFTSPEKFKSLISWLQVVIAIVLFGFYQVVPRLAATGEFRAINIAQHSYLLAFPPFWFSGAWSFLTGLQSGAVYIGVTVVALMLPVVSLWLVVRFLAPAFNQKLSMLQGSGDNATASVANAGVKRRRSLSAILASFLFRSNEAKISFRFTWIMTGRSRDFKLKVYPAIGYMVVMLGVGLYNRLQKSSFDAYLAGGKPTLLLLIVACSASILPVFAALTNLSYSEQFKAAWLFFITPVKKPGKLIDAASNTILVKFLGPLLVVVVILAGIFCKPMYYPTVLLAICNQVLIVKAYTQLAFKNLPFSQQQAVEAKGGMLFKTLFIFALTSVLGFVEYMLADSLLLISVLLVLSVTCSYFLIRTIQRRSWSQLYEEYGS